MDVYLGPSEIMVVDQGKNLISKGMQYMAREIGVTVKAVPVEAHHSIGMVERYRPILRRAYDILKKEMKEKGILPNNLLQMAVKALNNTAGPDGLVPTLLVFGAYPRMTRMDPPALSVADRAAAVRKAMAEVSKLMASRRVREALTMRNRPLTAHLYDLPVNADVLVWREKGYWSGPHKLLSIQGETCIIDMPYGPTTFRSTSVRPYNEPGTPEDSHTSDDDDNPVPREPDDVDDNDQLPRHTAPETAPLLRRSTRNWQNT